MKLKIAFWILCLLLGLVFIYSGYTKLYPIEPFEFTFVDLGIVNWQMTPFAARIFIGLELLIGALLIFNINLKKLPFKIAIAALLFFSIYLVLVILFIGNKGNCGCFGTHIEMTPFQALGKNIIMIVLLLVLNKYYSGWIIKDKLYRRLSVIFILFFIALPFILNPIALNYSKAYLDKPENNFKLELDTLYKYADLNVPPKSLSNGKHIIAFMSATCPHCRIAAKKMHIIQERKPFIPFYMVLIGEDKNIKSFFEESNSGNIPYCRLNHKNFFYLAGTTLPAIYLLKDGIVEANLDYFNLNESEIEKWLLRK